MSDKPPQLIDGAHLLLFTRIDSRHEPTQACDHTVAGAPLPTVAGLAICRYDEAGPFYVFYCDDAWNVLTDTAHDTLEQAREQAESEYLGSMNTWEPSC